MLVSLLNMEMPMCFFYKEELLHDVIKLNWVWYSSSDLHGLKLKHVALIEIHIYVAIHARSCMVGSFNLVSVAVVELLCLATS